MQSPSAVAHTAHPPIIEEVVQKKTRVESIDLLRGVVMIIMALDHVRDYFHADAFVFDPLDLERTTPAIFATRWITHLCAPVFVFLAGTSAYMIGLRKGKRALSQFLLVRGFWLILLEFTIINFAWFFNIKFSFLALTVIWALGVGMIVLSAAVHLTYRSVLLVGLAIVLLHNLLDPVQVEGDGFANVTWSLLHAQNFYQTSYFSIFIGYPILPWAAIMMLGYCFGKLYEREMVPTIRRRNLMVLGLSLMGGFVIIRAINIYGDPHGWSAQADPVFTFLSFMNVTKYPPSLLYTAITLGPAFVFLSVAEDWKGRISNLVVRLGRVPMFYYIVHLYVIHLIAVVAAVVTGFPASAMVFNIWVTMSPELKGYGFSLIVVYGIWALVIIILFPLCLWYERFKATHPEQKWLSYL